MAETSIQAARRRAREKRERAEAAEAARIAAEKEREKEPADEEGFFASFFNRGDALEEGIEGRQSTDSNNK